MSDSSLVATTTESASMQKLLYVFTRAPYSNASGLEALDAVLIGAAFEQDVSLLFVHDGVFQLKRQQDPRNTPLKAYTKTFKALADFDVNKLYVHDLSLVARGLSAEQLMVDVQELDRQQTANLISQQSRVFTF